MKKLFFSLFLICGLCMEAYAAQPAKKTYDTSLQTCSAYTETQHIDMFGVTVVNTRKILGKRNGNCVTEEISYIKGQPEKRKRIVCNIPEKDRKELIQAMLCSTDENNTYAAVMTRIMNDTKICKSYGG